MDKKTESALYALPPFRSKQITEAQEYLEIVHKAERYLAKNMHETVEGIYWFDPADGRIDLTFYSGCAGILYFYIKLDQAENSIRYQEIIQKATAYLLAHLDEVVKNKVRYEEALPSLTKRGLYFGIGGVGMVFLEVWRRYKDPRAEQGAKRVAAYYLSRIKKNRRGTHWAVSPAVAMDGGILLYLLDFYRAFPNEEVRKSLSCVGEAYLARGRRQKDGTLLYDGYCGVLPYSTPNWEFGNSGAGYVLAMLYDFSKDERYLKAAEDTARYLLAVKVPQGNGYLIPYKLYRYTRKPPVFYAGLCHGPVGSSRLFYKLYLLTGEEFWYEQVIKLTNGLAAIQAPDQPSLGLWNNVSYCCGHGGFLHHFLALYHVEHAEQWHNMAIRCGRILAGEMKMGEDGDAKWAIAWERVRPDLVTTPLGYFDGTAGIAATLLELYLTETGQYVWPRLIDDPFPEISTKEYKQ